MKRILSAFIVLSMLLSVIPITTNMVYASEYNGFTYTIDNNQVKITKGATNTTDIIIPSEIEGYPVTEIGKGAFNNYTNITSVKIPNTVNTIGYGAFYGCIGLTDITIPESVTTIDHMAFQHCSNLENVTMLNGVKFIGQQVFLYCQKLKTLTLPVSIKTIQKESFYDCKNLKSVYYSGSPTDFSKIEIGANNNYLTNANITYNYIYPVVFEISDASGAPGENVIIDVNIPSNSQVCSGRFDLVYDNTKIDIISASAGTLISNPTINQNYAANKIRIVFVGITPLTDAGSILSVEFKIKDSATGQADLALENLKVSDVTASLLNSIATNNSITINEHTHAWGAWNITKKPTQTETGTAERICGNDSSHKETATLPKLTDSSVWTIGTYVAPTCESAGSQEYTSTYGTVTETIPATGHAWGAWNITKKPTQTETGTAERICGNDSSHKETDTLPVLTDTTVWTKGTYSAPTCEGAGSQEYTSAYGTVTETIPATGHAWGAWSITTKPTQTETGTAERICNNDSSHKDTATLPVLTDASVWTIGTYIAPTCEGTGSQEYTSIYGKVVETIPATEHAWGAWNITVNPTKTETGTAERICGNDSSHKETATLPKLTDSSVWTIGTYVAPTCEGTGSQEYISSVYGTVIETIPATGHAWGAWNITTKPTKTETGTAERVCGNDSSHKDTATLPVLTDTTVWTVGAYVAQTCENTGSQEYTSAYGTVTETISATGHAWSAWNITKKPTQTETGSAERICGNDSSHKDTITLPKLTDDSVWTIGAYVAPTCEDTGSQEYTSTVYGTVIETIPVTGHAWGAWNITKKPTQTETGTAERICGNDNSHKDTMTLPVLTDTTVWTIGAYVAPTCENTGSQEYTSAYGKVVETIPATGHAWGAWNITKKPTQTETGTAERICGNDSSHKETAILPVLTDTTVWTKGTYVSPTCENTGSQEYTSTYGTVTETIPATGHAWGAWNITKKPTQTETGTAERICGNDSSHKDTITLPKLTDSSVWTIGTYVAPTCEDTGSQEYISSVYGTVTETIPATGHSWGAWNITKKPTQTETGTAERICGNDSSHKETATLPKLTDSSVWTIGTYVAPTCESAGSQEYTSTYGTVTETIPATGHAWSAWNITKKPTQTETGSAERICGNDSSHKDTAILPVLTDTTVWTVGAYIAPTCEDAGSQEYISLTYGNITEIIPATGHSWGAWSITKKPTQTETGKAERICSNDSTHKDTIILPKLTDDSIWTIGTYVAPTCENTGSQEYTSIYGKVVETISATGHAWGAWSITTKPTKTETGVAERICGNNSSHKDTATLPVLTDTTVWTVGAYVAPTCENTGSQEYISSVYGTVTETIPATGHAWGAWNITKKPTQNEAGTAERICGNDSSHKDTATLPKLTDSSVWTIGAYVAPTCEDTGSQEYISTVYGKVVETIPATGHAWGAWSITTKPTKTETGVAERICGNDSSHKDTVTLPVLTDVSVWTVGAYVAPTCEGAGSQEYISSTYGTVTETIPATGHAWSAWNITKKPTQTETGSAERICGNDSSHKDTAILPVLTDTTVWTKGAYVAPTCENTGSQEYTCAYGTVVETILATGHAWGAWNITKKPTQTEPGTAERICGNDSSHKDTVTLPVLTDTTAWTIGAYVAPTCENTGSQEYISSVYGTVTEIIPATGHAWGEWTITKEPTQTETGTAERICSNDSSHKDTATLPVLTDATVWTKGAYAAPTCENTGSQEYTSAYGTVVEIISALGHSFNILQHDDTKHWYKCERCTAINNEENHTGGQATKTERAVCSVCNTPYGKLLPNYVLPTDLKTTYGKTLSDIILPAGWKWTDSSIIPTVINNGYEAYYTIDNDTDYDWTKENGYDASVNQIKLNLTVNVEKAEQDISYAINSINKYTTDSAFTNELTKNIVQGALSFSSSNENVAIVDNNGLVTIKGAGTAIITATVSETENYKGRSASYTINVTRYSSHSGGGGSSTSYTISFDTNGGTQIDSVRVRRNGLLKEPERPVKAGYMFDGWYSDKELSVKYEFASKVTKSFTLYAKWHEEKSDNNHSGISDWENPFKDVHKNDWFYDSVKYVYINGMMKGVASDLFAPDGNITRAMFITVLYRIENEPDTECDNSFNDVEANSYYEKAVYWGRKNGIVKGITNTEYAPDLNITREQMAAMIYRYMTYKNMDLSVGENTNILSYADCSNISDYAIPAMQYAIGSGIIKGMTDNTLEPQGISTRAQAATVFMRTFKLLKK